MMMELIGKEKERMRKERKGKGEGKEEEKGTEYFFFWRKKALEVHYTNILWKIPFVEKYKIELLL